MPTVAPPTVPARPAARASGTRPAELAAEVRIALSRAFRRLRAERGPTDLPDPQFVVLAWLHKKGPLTPGALAELERVQPPSMTRAVNALVEAGLVVKSDHPTDGRQVVVTLSERGAAEVRETRRRRDTWLSGRLATLTPAERSTLAEAAVLLRRIAEE
jgi:DNA-binding MarR family transcriptional regulator